MPTTLSELQQFLLTRLLRGVTISKVLISYGPRFLLTRLLRGVTVIWRQEKKHRNISTHTPLARRDDNSFFCILRRSNFYSHASCEA